MNVEEFIGKKFGRLTVLEVAEWKNKYKPLMRCRCDCGKEAVVLLYNLKNGHTKSCGCYKLERDIEYHTKHGQRHTRLYNVWCRMIRRTNKPQDKKYRFYGGRGIKICDEWRDFSNFYKWAIESGYKEETLPNGKNKWTIDRIDTNGNYEPSNCRWITIQEQQNNRISNVYYTYNGETMTLANLARKYNVNYKSLWSKLHRGWSMEEAIQGKRDGQRVRKKD